jgi:hypothetical protein
MKKQNKIKLDLTHMLGLQASIKFLINSLFLLLLSFIFDLREVLIVSCIFVIIMMIIQFFLVKKEFKKIKEIIYN